MKCKMVLKETTQNNIFDILHIYPGIIYYRPLEQVEKQANTFDLM